MGTAAVVAWSQGGASGDEAFGTCNAEEKKNNKTTNDRLGLRCLFLDDILQCSAIAAWLKKQQQHHKIRGYDTYKSACAAIHQ